MTRLFPAFFLAITLFCQEPVNQNEQRVGNSLPNESPREIEKAFAIEDVKLDSMGKKITWIVSSGSVIRDNDGKETYFPEKMKKYEIILDKKFMTADGKKVAVHDYEATLIKKLVEILVRYVVDSTNWWEKIELKIKDIEIRNQNNVIILDGFSDSVSVLTGKPSPPPR